MKQHIPQHMEDEGKHRKVKPHAGKFIVKPFSLEGEWIMVECLTCEDGKGLPVRDASEHSVTVHNQYEYHVFTDREAADYYTEATDEDHA